MTLFKALIVSEGLFHDKMIIMKINVVVKPGSSREEIEEVLVSDSEHERELTIWTHARAHDGEANKKVIEMIADYYKVPKTSVRLVRGATSRVKVFEI